MKSNRKKYFAGRHALIQNTLCFFAGIVVSCLLFYIIKNMGKQPLISWILIGVIEGSGLVCIWTAIYDFISDPIFWKYSFDEKGITLYSWVKQIRFSWTDFIDAGFTRWQADAGIGTTDYIYYIYFSKKRITLDKQWIFSHRSFRKPKKPNLPVYLNDYVLIQYSIKRFDLLTGMLPSELGEKLIEERKHIRLKIYEKLLNN